MQVELAVMHVQEAMNVASAALRACEIEYEMSVSLFKRQLIVSALERNKWNQCRTALELNMHRNSLARAMAQLKIQKVERQRESRKPKAKRSPDSLAKSFGMKTREARAAGIDLENTPLALKCRANQIKRRTELTLSEKQAAMKARMLQKAAGA